MLLEETDDLLSHDQKNYSEQGNISECKENMQVDSQYQKIKQKLNLVKKDPEEQKVKDKAKRKKRIQFITSTIKAMQKKRTFMTAPEMLILEDEEEKEVKQTFQHQNVEPQQDIFDEYRSMLQDVINTQKVVREGTDDLTELRKMIQTTKVNINSHINTVDYLTNSLQTIQEKSKDALLLKRQKEQYQEAVLKKNSKQFNSHKQLPSLKMNGLMNTKSQSKQAQTKTDQKLQNELDNMIFSASHNIDMIKEAKLQQRPNYEHETKVEIINTLLNINGSMKEFSEDIEKRMHKAFNCKAGKKYGLSDIEIEMRKALSNQPSFGKVRDQIKEVDFQAKAYMSDINSKYLRKNVLANRL